MTLIRDIIGAPESPQVDCRAWITQAATLASAPARPVRRADITRIVGIGPAYAAKLRGAGITELTQLAGADEARLAEIIDAPAWQRVNYGAWIAQAKVLLGEEG